MGTAERRHEIMRLLCRRRHDTIENIAFEFGVSERTVRRDIEILSLSEPIYTQSGRYGGGVYIMEDYSPERMYFSEKEENVLRRILVLAESGNIPGLSKEETEIFKQTVNLYTKPKPKKGN